LVDPHISYVQGPVLTIQAGGGMMVARVTAGLSLVKPEGATPLHSETIIGAWEAAGSTTWRDRVLTSVTTMQLCLGQMQQGNTACRHLPPLSGRRFTAAADGQARARLPRRFFDRLLERCHRAVPRSVVDDGRWQGPRPYRVDGSGDSRPATPSREVVLEWCEHSARLMARKWLQLGKAAC
jgi:hypothetical protein